MYIHVNGIDIWYEAEGSGPPIILLHGNGENHKIFGVLMSQLRDKFSVYAIDSRNHGQSKKTGDINYDLMTEDVAAFITELKLDKPILYGFSDGGIIGLLLASRYPRLLSKMVISGANTEPDGIKKLWAVLFKTAYFFTRDSKIKMMLTEPHISDEEIRKICIPVLVLAGEKDLIRKEHTEKISANIGNSELKIIPKENHMSYVTKSPKLYGIIKDFIEN